jgi:polar amino acid transport system permease protein
MPVSKQSRIFSALLMVFLCFTIAGGVSADTYEPAAEEVPMGSLQRGEFTLPTENESGSERFWRITFDLLDGFRFNGILFSVTLVLSLPLGMIVTFGLMSKITPVRWLCKTIVWIVRGSPLMLQIFIVFFVPGLVFGVPFRDRLLAATIAFVINYAMFFAEIYRGALENMPKGQFEAGKVLGLSKVQVFFNIILFQVIKNSSAAIGNEVINLLKDTSLARVVAVSEILMRAQGQANLGIIWPLFYTLVFYLSATGIITLLFMYFERRLKRATGE